MRVLMTQSRIADLGISPAFSFAALALRPEDTIYLRCSDVEVPADTHAAQVSRAVAPYADGRALPTIELLGNRERPSSDTDLTIDCSSLRRQASAVADLVAALPGEARGTPRDPWAIARDDAVARRDISTGEAPLMVVALLQVQSYWPALADLCAELDSRADVVFEVVGMESEHDVRSASTMDFLRAQGYQPRDLDWLRAQCRDTGSGLCAVLTCDPYDGLRDPAASAGAFSEAGVRVVYVPYSPNPAAGDQMIHMAYDLPVHRLAWRVFAASERQKRYFEQYCSSGAAHVRVLGTPKLDRAVRGETDIPQPWVDAARGRPVLLWNPHYSIGPTGWSTFVDYGGPLLQHIADRDDVVLLIRPHFRLFRDLRLAGPRGAAIVDRIVSLADRAENIIIDGGSDYLPALVFADAMVSDLSSLIADFFVMGKPVMYLHRSDGPGLNEDADYFLACDIGTSIDDITRFVHDTAERRDPSSSTRLLGRERWFAHEDGRACRRIADDIVQSIVEERRQGTLRREVDRASEAEPMGTA